MSDEDIEKVLEVRNQQNTNIYVNNVMTVQDSIGSPTPTVRADVVGIKVKEHRDGFLGFFKNLFSKSVLHTYSVECLPENELNSSTHTQLLEMVALDVNNKVSIENIINNVNGNVEVPFIVTAHKGTTRLDIIKQCHENYSHADLNLNIELPRTPNNPNKDGLNMVAGFSKER